MSDLDGSAKLPSCHAMEEPMRKTLRISLSPCLLLFLASTGLGQSAPKLALDQTAPEISAMTLEGKPTSLAALRGDNKDKILVLQFGSLTDPLFRAHAANAEKLAIKES